MLRFRNSMKFKAVLTSVSCLTLSGLVMPVLPVMATAPVGLTLTDEEARDVVTKSMADEIGRSMKALQVPGRPKPYYLRYEVYDNRNQSVTYELGAKTNESDQTSRAASADVRVGSYEYDSSVHPDSSKARAMTRSLPVDDDYGSIRRQLWMLTDDAYKYATEQFDQSQSYKRGHDVRHLCEAFSKEHPKKTILPMVPEVSLSPELINRVKELSKLFEKYPRIRSSYITLEANHGVRRVVTSEGTVSRYSRNAFEVGIVAYARTPDGVDTWDCDYIAADEEKDLPSAQEMQTRVEKLAANLTAETNAERMDYYYGPVLFENAAAGELVQHGVVPLLCAIPGDNLQPGKTLLRSINMRVLPEFINITDEPQLRVWSGRQLAGHGTIDSDGFPTEKVKMVEGGFLKSLLTGRTPVVPGQHTNGHNIFDEVTPTTVVVSATKTLDAQAMRKKLLDLAKARGLKEAIIVRRIVPNNALVVNGTATDARSDTVNNRLVEIYAVDVESGKERRVRGLQIGEFSRQSMDSIVAAGNDADAHTTANWRGYVRSIIAPSLLIENMELDEDAGDSLSPYPVSRPEITSNK